MENKPISKRTILAIALYKEIQDVRTRFYGLQESDTQFSDDYTDLGEQIKSDIESLDIQIQTLMGQSFLRDIELLLADPDCDGLTPDEFSALV